MAEQENKETGIPKFLIAIIIFIVFAIFTGVAIKFL